MRIWVEEGKTEEWIATKLNERSPESKFTQQDVNRFKNSVLKRVQTPETRIASKWNKDAEDALRIVQEAVDYALQQPVESTWTPAIQSSIQAKLAVAREKLRLLGQYPKEGVQIQNQIAIALGGKAQWVREFIESIQDDDLRQRLLALL